jgi:acyl-CoA reductase-like NAD-dependent aldehyde dehydrogenase
MAKAARKLAEPEGPPVLRSTDPSTGKVIGEVASAAPEEVREAVAAARRAQPAWAALTARERARHLGAVRHRIHRDLDAIVETISRENGKPPAEALSHDIVPTLLTLAYLERVAPRALRPQNPARVLSATLGVTSRIEFRPFGVVGVISPWNYPLFLAFMGVVPALLAGNAVVLKPSEATPGVGERMREVLSVLPEGVVQVVQGAGEVGAALVDAPCDKLVFIGSTATGRRIAEAAAKHLTPVVMELGGQDAAIVCDDADLDVASSGVLWGAFFNAGQTCASIERVYAVESVADEFTERLLAKLGQVTAGPGGDIGPLTIQRQLDTVERHVGDAVEKGAKVLHGGPSDVATGNGGGLWFAPTVLEGRSEDMALFAEETFGPVLPIVRGRDVEEAIERANSDGVNLTASVWTSKTATAKRVASRLVAGTVTVNDHATTASLPWGIWGGVGESGYGRLLGEIGLREMTVPVHVSRSLLPHMKKIWWYPYDEASTGVLRGTADLLGAPGLGAKARALGQIAGKARAAFKGKL